MYQFFIEPDQIKNSQVRITGQDFLHIKQVVRLRMGERFRISTTEGKNYFCTLTDYEEDAAIGKIMEEDCEGTELNGNIWLFQGLPKQEKMELIIQKAVELGASSIVPVAMKRSVVKLDEKKAREKVKRWQAISEAAAKQSKRSIVPEVLEVCTYKQALGMLEQLDITLLPYENEKGISYTRELLSQIKPGKNVGIIIGPEGGFEQEEVSLAIQAGAFPVTLGKRILRTETAAIAALTLVMLQMEKDEKNGSIFR